MIFPSIDLLHQKVVQLEQGDPNRKKIEREDVFALAKEFAKIGPINVIDLDAAFGIGNHKEIILKLAKEIPIRVGGGIRDLELAQSYIEGGVQKVIIGTAAFKKGFLKKLAHLIDPKRVIIALDSYEDDIVVKGWKEKMHKRADEVIQSFEPYASEFLFTQVANEGLMKGPDFERLKKLKKLTKRDLTAAGGISSMEEVEILHNLGIHSVIGMALYTGKFKP